MMLIADSQGRLTCAELFVPGKPYAAEKQPDGSIRVVPLAQNEVPMIKLRRVKGKLVRHEGPRPTREQIAAAVRADRDSR